MTTLKSLRSDARDLNIRGYRDMNREELAKAINAKIDAAAQQAEREAAREAANQARKVEQERAAARRADGIVIESDKALFYCVEGARSNLKAFEAEKTRFLANIESDPVYALSWSKSFFEATANARVAQELIAAYEAGHSPERITAKFIEDSLGRAQYAANASTSQTSNLMDIAITQAYAKAAANLNRPW